MVIGYLRHGSRHTSRKGGLVVQRRAIGIVGIDLVPRSGEQWADISHNAAGAPHSPGDFCNRVGRVFLLSEHTNLPCIDGNHLAQCSRDVLGIERTAVGITENLAGAVVTRDDDKAALSVDVEHIDSRLTCRGGSQLRHNSPCQASSALRRLSVL